MWMCGVHEQWRGWMCWRGCVYCRVCVLDGGVLEGVDVLEGCWRGCVRGCVCWRGGCVVGVGVNV